MRPRYDQSNSPIRVPDARSVVDHGLAAGVGIGQASGCVDGTSYCIGLLVNIEYVHVGCATS